jgi:hypothetical protein
MQGSREGGHERLLVILAVALLARGVAAEPLTITVVVSVLSTVMSIISGVITAIKAVICYGIFLFIMLFSVKFIGIDKPVEMTDGAEFNAEYKMVRFTPDMKRPDHTDPSYHLPAFYELWARWGPEADRSFWAEAAKVSRDFFQKATNPTTGLAPDYANFDGTPVTGGFTRGPRISGPTHGGLRRTGPWTGPGGPRIRASGS